jgi:hypothetical protein
MSCEIIQFSTAARIPPKRRKPIVRAAGASDMSRVEIEQEPEQPARDEGELTVTCQNGRLRDARREVWHEAETIRQYWQARLKMESAIARAQSHGLPEGNNHPPHNPDERCSQTGAKPSRNSCLRPLRTLRRSLGKRPPWTVASMSIPTSKRSGSIARSRTI